MDRASRKRPLILTISEGDYARAVRSVEGGQVCTVQAVNDIVSTTEGRGIARGTPHSYIRRFNLLERHLLSSDRVWVRCDMDTKRRFTCVGCYCPRGDASSMWVELADHAKA